MPTKCYRCQLHCFLRWHRQTFSSSQYDLVLVKKRLFAALYACFGFKYHMHTNCCGTYILRMPSEWGFQRLYFYMRYTLSTDLWPMSVTTVAHTQQPEKYYKHIPGDLSCYCHFGETLLTPSRVVDTSTIYLRRCAVGAFVAVTCTNKSGRFHSVLAIGSYSKLHGGVHL